MARREGIITKIACCNWCAESLSERLTLVDRVAHHHAATGQNYRKLRSGQQISSSLQAIFTAGTALNTHGLGNLAANFTVEKIPGNIQLRWPHL